MHVPWIPSDRDDRDDQWRRDLAGTPARPRCEEFLSSCDGCEGLCNGEDRVGVDFPSQSFQSMFLWGWETRHLQLMTAVLSVFFCVNIVGGPSLSSIT